MAERMEKVAYVRRKSFADTRLDLDFFIHFFCFLSVLFIGADRFGLNIGVNFRLDQIFLCILAVLLAVKGKLRFIWNWYIGAFLGFGAISTILAFSFMRGLLFYFSMCYNVIFLFYTFAAYVTTYGIETIIKILRATCYVQFFVILLQFALKVIFNYELPFMPGYGYFFGVPRFQIWFYEPSFLANYLIFWFALSFYMYLIGKEKSYLLDLIVALAMFLISTSTTGFVGIAMVVVTVYFMWLFRNITVKKLLWPLGILVILVVLLIVFHSMFEVFLGRLFTNSLDTASGGRITHWKETFDVFSERPIFGVGPGCYGLYLGEEAGYVPSNVTLELMATLGIFGTVSFYGLTNHLVVRSVRARRQEHNHKTLLLVACAYALVIFTILLQVNQGYLRLYHWMFFGILYGGLRELRLQKQHCMLRDPKGGM